MASIASPLLGRTSHCTSGCFSHFNLCRLSGAKCLFFELVMQPFASTRLSFCFLEGSNLFSCSLHGNATESYLLYCPLQRPQTDTQVKGEKFLVPFPFQAHEASQWTSSLPATEHGEKKRYLLAGYQFLFFWSSNVKAP